MLRRPHVLPSHQLNPFSIVPSIHRVFKTPREAVRQKSLVISVARGWILTFIHRQYVARLRFVFEMQFDTAGVKLKQHQLDAPFDGRMVGTIARDEFIDNGPECCGRQLQMGYTAVSTFIAKTIMTKMPRGK
jgi:hypothetical protein